MVQKVKYSIIKKINNIEIRKYPEIILAIVEDKNDNSAFGLLFNYISGYNNFEKNIEMTAPVINSKKIEMTSPVISKENYMAFIMPSEYNKKNIPIPLDPRVKIKVQKERALAIIKFGGNSTNSKIKKYKEKLLEELKKKNIKTKDEPLLFRYNSPFAPPFIRKNEVGIEILND